MTNSWLGAEITAAMLWSNIGIAPMQHHSTDEKVKSTYLRNKCGTGAAR
jgi:hypothetical protein